MSMSTSVSGFVPPDEKFNAMYAVYQSCEKAGVPIPVEVSKFFNGEKPDINGVIIHLTHGSPAVKEWHNDYAQGYEVDLTKLPKDIKILRFDNTW